MADRSSEASDLFRQLVEQSLGLMCIHDLDGTLLFVNAAAARSLGWSPEDGVGANLRRFLAPDVVDQFDAYIGRIRANSEDSGLMRLVAKDGTERIWRYRNILQQEPGMTPRVLGHALDVTEQVHARRALRESERRFRLLADTAPVMIWMSGPDGECAFLNQSWLDFTGQSLETQQGEGWIERVHPEDRDRVRLAQRDAVAARGPLQLEYRLRRADAEFRWVLARGVPRIEADGGFAGLVGSCLDITEIRQARGVLERARDELTALVAERTADLRESKEQLRAEMERRARVEEELARSRRLESLGALATEIAEEFGDLLSVILGRAHALSDRLSSGIRHDVDSIQGAARRAAELIQQLLAFARRQSLQPHLFDLNHLVTGMSLPTVIAGRAELRLSLEEGLRLASVDPGQIQRAVVHLVENACAVMPEGGQLILETANVQLDESFTRTRPDTVSGSYVRLTVREAGAGAARAGRVFEPFVTAEGGEDPGDLGLAAVYGITRQHGGYFEVEKESGRTAFTIYLPAGGDRDSATIEASPSRKPGPHGTETLLLVEEDEGVRWLLRDILHLHGYRVIEFGDPEQALSLAERRAAPIHLVITDVSMSKMSGPTLVDRITVPHPGVKALYMSGYAAEVLGAQGVLPGRGAFLEKPFTMVSLLGKVREVLDA